MRQQILLTVVTALLFLIGCGDDSDESPVKGLDLAALGAEAVNYQPLHDNDEDISNSRRTAITNAVEKVSQTVCGINVTQIREARRGVYFDDPFFRFFFPERIPRQAVKSLGSGFLISPDGFILTNEHVVHNATEIVVSLSDGTTANAEMIGSDYITDIALIRIKGDHYPYIRFGDSNEVIIGEWVIALGNPFGLFEINAKPTVTVGVVSAVDRDFGRQRNDRVYQDMIQTDAAINQGNSGGPLVNSLGQVIGMNTFIYTGGNYSNGSIGLGFAIPSNRIKRILGDLKEYGEVNRRWTTGLVVEEIPPMVARYFGLKSTHGVIVTSITQGSPAARAGLEVGDIIVEVNGERIKNEHDIWRIIDDSDLRGGDMLKLKVVRERKVLEILLELEELTR
ncbi:MAG: S1C family serine protease [bacterium]